MKRIKKNYGKNSLRSVNRFFILIISIILGLGFMGVETVLELTSSYMRQTHEISTYEAQIKARIKEEVTEAIQIANYYYIQHKDTLPASQVQQNILALLSELKSNDVGYFFSADYQGNNLLGPDKGNNVYNIEDMNGLKVVQELIKTAKAGGGYVTYVMPPLKGIEQVPKISYVLPFEPYSWYIGAGVNLSEIDTIKDQIRTATIQQTLRILLVTSVIVIFMVLVFQDINKRLYRKIEDEVNLITNYLDKSVTISSTLDTDSLSILELEQIGRHTVSLIERRNEDQVSLEEVNQSLEEEATEHATTIELLNESQRRLASIVNTIPDTIFIMDENGTYLDCEAGDTLWLGDYKESYIGKNVRDVLPEAVALSCIKTIREALRSNKMQTHEFQLGKGDTVEYFETRIIAFQKCQVLAIMRDVTDTKKFQLTNEYLSYHDQLTGAYNRRYFEELLIRLDDVANLPIALAMVDVNGLKMTNDAFGHQTGDRLLCLVTDILQKNCPGPNGFIARIGGDEFVIVCPNTDPAKMEKLVGDIYASIDQEKQKYSIVSVSIGWEIKTYAEQNMTDIFNKAEEMMYRKKLTESQSVRYQAVEAILKTLNEKNVREKIHSERVSVISRLMGEAMNLDYSTVKEIETAGLLHDIGKIVVDEHILNKEGHLNDEEYEKIKKHPESSYQILKSINAYAGLAEDVLSHHERLDGHGYPRRLKGDEIPLIARIISIADAYEAMTADRSYRLAMSKDQALDELKQNAGTQFDPQIVRIFEEKVFPQL